MPRKPNFGTEHDDEIERLYIKEKLSMSAIAKKLGMQTMTVKRKLLKRGVEIRGISTAMTLHHLRNRRYETPRNTMGKVTGDIQNDDVFCDNSEDDDWLD